MSSYQAESVFVPVIPSFRSFASKLIQGMNSPQATRAAARAGETVGRNLGESLADASGRSGKQSADDFMGSFSRQSRGQIRAQRGRFEKDFGGVGDQSGRKFSQGFGKSMSGGGGGGGIVGVARKAIAPLAALFAGVELFNFGKDAVGAASSLQQSTGGVEAVFGRYAKRIKASAAGAAQSFGLSKNAYQELASALGASLKNKGIKDFAGQTDNLIKKGSDLAAQFGGSTKEAVEAIGSALRGETDPIERYGVSMNQAAIEAEAFRLGLIKPVKNMADIKIAQDRASVAQVRYNAAVKEYGKDSVQAISAQAGLGGATRTLEKALKGVNPKLTEQQKATAALSVLNRQTADATGAFARESDTLAGKQARANAQWENTKALLGNAILPLVTQFFGFLNTTGIPAVTRLATVLAANVGPAFNRLRTFLGPVISGIVRLFSGIQTQGPPVARFFNGKLMPAFLAIVAAGRRLGVTLLPIIRQIAAEFMRRWPVIAPLVKDIFKTISEIVLNVMAIIKRNIQNVTTVIRFIWSKWGKQITTLVGSAFEMVVRVISGAMKIVGGIVKVITGIMTGDWKKAKAGITDIVKGLRTILVAIWNNIRTQVQVILGRLIENLVGRWTGFLRWVGGRLRSGLATIQGHITRPISAAASALGRILLGIRSAFSTAVTRIGQIWDGLKAKAKAPIKFIIDTVLNGGLIRAFNTISRAVNGPTIGAINVPGFREGGPTGRVGKRRIAGVVHGNEHVVTDEEVRKAPGGHRFWESIRDQVLHGKLSNLPGYFLGGGVRPVPGGARKHSGYGFARWAGDMSAGMGTPVKAWKAGIVAAVRRLSTSYGHHVRINHGGAQTLYAHLSRIAVSAGQRVRAGQKIGNVGSTGNSTGPHLHFEIRGGGAPIGTGSADKGSGSAPLGPVQSLASWIREKVAAVTAKFAGAFDGPLGRLKEISGSPIGQLAGAAVRKLIDPIKDFITGKAKAQARSTYNPNLADAQFQGTPDGTKATGATGAGRAGLRRAALRLGSHSAFYHSNAQGPSMDMMVRNRNIGNSIASHAKKNARRYNVEYLVWNRRIWNIRRNAEGWRKYTGTSNPHTDHVHSTHFDRGGWLQPGLNQVFNGTGKPEPVLTDAQWSAIGAQTRGGDSGAGVHDNVFYGYTPRDVVNEARKYDAEQRALHPSWSR